MHLDRLDRHVWRSHIRMSEGTSRYRATCALEDALRLTDLPGEREGRVYYFRRVSLGAIPAHAGRVTWMDRVQLTLGELAAQAVHGSDPRAVANNAVYFDNFEQALEALLRRSLRAGTNPAWYSSAVLGDPPDSSSAISVLRIVERMRQPDLSPASSSSIILSSLGHSDPAALLNELPIAVVRGWLRDLEGSERAPAPAVPISLPGSLKATLRLAAQQFGWKEPRTLWLAVLGAMVHASSALSAADALRRARSTLQRMALELPPESRDVGAMLARADVEARLRFEPNPVGPTAAAPAAVRDAAAAAEGAPESHARHAPAAAARDLPAASSLAALDAVRNAVAATDAAAPAVLGDATAAAGLYFLLQVLRHLGLPTALAANPQLAEAQFAAHLLQRLAAHARVAADDPILQCLSGDTAEPLPETLSADARAWPKDWPASPRACDGRVLLRIWCVAVRRWSRRNAGINVREIVERSGRVWLTRAELDVTLPLAALDVRIRRVGLDIDPGWLPWFGRFGRVVRFHYRARGLSEGGG